MKRIWMLLLLLLSAAWLTACSTPEQTSAETTEPEPAVQEIQEETDTAEAEPQIEESVLPPSEEEAKAEEDSEMRMQIGDTPVSVEWENNESVEALRDLTADGPLTIQMSMYGGFEQVGSIGRSLPRDDGRTTTASGDIVLYSGDQIVVFYGSNTWAYTRLGHITDQDEQAMEELLGNGDVIITIETSKGGNNK